MMEAARTSETLAYFYQTTWCYNPEDSHLPTLKGTNDEISIRSFTELSDQALCILLHFCSSFN
jgi:hypothetical protein